MPLPDGSTEVRGLVRFDRLRLADMTPGLAGSLCRLVDQPIQSVRLESRNRVFFDAKGRLLRFCSTVATDALDRVIRLDGVIEGSRLKLVVQLGDIVYPTEVALPAGALVDESLSPQTHLPGLHEGQTWTVPSYSLFRPPGSKAEILRAAVEGHEWIAWEGHMEQCWLVVYRSGSDTDLDGIPPQQKLWVQADGTVLKQEIMLLDLTLTFVRTSPERAAKLAARLRDVWKHGP